MTSVDAPRGAAGPNGGPLTCWVLTNGRAGDETPALGVAAALGATVEIRRVAPRRPWVWAMPWGPVDPAEGPDRPKSPIAPPWPDVVIGCGRRAVAYMREIKRRAGPATFTVFLRDPRTSRHGADFLWVPEHDPTRGPNVLATTTTPHRISAAVLAAARRAPPEPIAALPRPRVAVLLGGGSRRYGFGAVEAAALARDLEGLAADAGSFMITPSRRSPPFLVEAVRKAMRGRPGFVWDGSEPNPYIPMLANADAIVVTGDSYNMVCEAVATGRPVMVFEPVRLKRKLRGFLAELTARGAIRPFHGRLEDYMYDSIDSTPVVAREIRARLEAARRIAVR